MVSPPSLAQKLLEWFIKDELAEEVLGDLEEKYYRKLKETNTTKAKLNYWYQVLNYLRPFALKNYRSNSNISDMLSNHFKISFRNIRKNRGYSFLNIGGLALGIAVFMLISLWIKNEINFNKYHPEHDRVAQVVQNLNNNGEIETWFNMPFPLSEELRTNYGSNFKRVAMALGYGDYILTVAGEKFDKTGVYIENDGPKLLGIELIKGTDQFINPASVIISESTASSLFGDLDPINQSLTIDDHPPVQVIGIFKDLPENSRYNGLEFVSSWDFLYANEPWFSNESDPWRPNFTIILVEINENLTFEEVSANIKEAKKKKIPEYLASKNPELFLHPMSNWYLKGNFENGINTGGRIVYVKLFGIVALFILLIACVNFMNLSTARSEKRAKEVGIRKTLGSVKWQLVLQFMTESILTVAAALVLSLGLIYILLPLFNSLSGTVLTIPWHNPVFWGLALGLMLIIGIISASYPSFYLSSFKPVSVLKGSMKTGRNFPRRVLIVFQFTISITLIIATITVNNQIQHAKNRPAGYAMDNLVSVSITPVIHQHFEAIKNRLLKSGTILEMAESQSTVTAQWGTTGGLSWEGKDPDISIDFAFLRSSHDYGRTIGWNIIEGRDFSIEVPSDSAALILNQAAIDYMALENPVGTEVTFWDSPYRIIGVVENVITQSPFDKPKPTLYRLSSGPENVALIKLNGKNSVQKNITSIEEVLHEYNQGQPLSLSFIDEDYSNKFKAEEKVGKIAILFAIMAIFISCLGIFGLASFMAEQRSKEISIRKVLGASVKQVWQLLTKDFLLLIIIACLLSAPISYYYLEGWLANYSYRINLTVVPFLFGGLLSLIITLITVSLQSIKAALSDPAQTLRSE